MEQELRGLMAELFEVQTDQITDSFSMKDTEVWDSLKHMELVLSVERTFGIDLTFDDIVDMKTVKDIKHLLKEKGVNGEDGPAR